MYQVLDFINFIISRLRKGAKYLFEELSKLIDEIFGVGKKVEELPKTASEQRVLEKREAKALKKEQKSLLNKKTIDGNTTPSYEKGFEYYEARTPKPSEIPLKIRRQAKLLTHKIDKEVKLLLDVGNTSGLSKGKKILLDKKGKKFIDKNWLKDRQLVAGMIHQDKKLGEIIVSKTNFPKNELKNFLNIKKMERGKVDLQEVKEIYKYFKQKGHIDFDMHSYIEELLEKHFNEVSKGIKHPSTYNWERTGGLPGTHAEVLALNDLLWTLENKGVKLNNDVLKGFLGYNKNIVKQEFMIRCGDCQLILKDILFLEKITKYY